MNSQQKWEKFKKHSDLARHEFLEAEYHKSQGNKGAHEIYMREHWYQLLLAAEVNYAPPKTEKQKRQQQLWQQRGHLERTRANLNGILHNAAFGNDYFPWGYTQILQARDAINQMINTNIVLMNSL